MQNQKESYSHDDLIEHANGNLFGEGFGRLPLPPMLMFDRIPSVTKDGGAYGRGQIEGEFDIDPELWFFQCHFKDDPVMPGCLGLDAMWQMVGFFLGWLGNKGKGRALGVGEVKFRGMVLPDAKLVSYHIDIRRVINRRLVYGVGDGVVKVDGEPIYEAKGMRVGLFEGGDFPE
ncbi:MAG: bifunctional 3-hydroxydecanoyl-ACP dehydratase/trans-2-decenoyl-ACP isomerase [Planctomycetes bacterium]|nr:bifunctional 3-hydroxydecanoyl-ACP dehydratase/trans-2-decenoyl-ACP isomerase [Planctomycetota bacterium]